jgi:hypothetical protein
MFELRTKGMAEREREYWWKAMGEVELQISGQPGLRRGKDDLGPELLTGDKGRTKRHQKRRIGDSGGAVPECVTEWYKQGGFKGREWEI